MSTLEIALLLHIAAAIAFFSGLVLAAVTTSAAGRRSHTREIAVLLGAARSGALLVAVSGVATLALGFWLVELTDREPSEAWLSASVALLIAAFILGGLGGRKLKRARKLATRAAEEGEEQASEALTLLRDPLARAANGLATLAAISILVLMVWRPGG